MTRDPARYLALLRGINVGGNRKIPMKDLAAVFEAQKCEAVATYIQSGNVAFSAVNEEPKKLRAKLEAAIAKRFGFEVPVVIVASGELRAIVDRNPFLERKIDVEKLHVGFLADEPTATEIASLDPKRSPPDEFVVHDRAVYLHLPNGVARTKLTNAYFDSKLGTTITVRNWRTAVALSELVRR